MNDFDRNRLEELTKNGLSIKIISEKFECSKSNIRYWLKKFGLKVLRKPFGKLPKSLYKCKQCGETDIVKMMNKGGGRKSSSLCKICHNLNTIERGKKNKHTYIAYKGGKCEKCGYSKCDAALEFHHIDSNKKDPRFTSIRYWGLEKAKKELDACKLVCANCHREIHNT